MDGWTMDGWMDGVVLIRSLDGWMVFYCPLAVISGPLPVRTLSLFLRLFLELFWGRFWDPFGTLGGGLPFFEGAKWPGSPQKTINFTQDFRVFPRIVCGTAF